MDSGKEGVIEKRELYKNQKNKKKKQKKDRHTKDIHYEYRTTKKDLEIVKHVSMTTDTKNVIQKTHQK